MITEALFVITLNWGGKKPKLKCPSTDAWINILWNSQTWEYYLAIKTNELLTHSTMWMNLKIIILTERSQTTTSKKVLILYKSIWKMQTDL